MTPSPSSSPQRPTPSPWRERWQAFSAGSIRAFHAYANWLVGISWRRFIVLSLLLLVTVAIVHDSPPFTWRFVEETPAPRIVIPPRMPAPPAPAAPPAKAGRSIEPTPGVRIDIPPGMKPGDGTGLDISIDKDGVRITAKPAADAASAAQAAASEAARAADAMASAAEGLRITLPPGADSEEIRDAIEEAKREDGRRRARGPA